MTDICFIYLPHPYLKRPDAQLPMGILMLAAVIKQDGRYSVEVKNYSSYTTEQAIEDLPKAEIYGITVTSMEIPQANDFAKAIKTKYGWARIVVGGPGARTIYERELEWDEPGYIDSIAIGEAEHTVFEIIYGLENGVFDNHIYECQAPINLDDLPYPAREMIDGQIGGDVFAYNKNYIGEGSTAILSSRGCPFKCAFCAAPALTSTVRYRSPDSVAEEIKCVIRDYGIRQFRFSDDLFTANKHRVMAICELIGDLGIAWRVSARVTPLDKEMLFAMKDAGCKELSFGIESFDNDVLKLLNKKATVEDNIKALRMADEVGIDARILLMAGTPGQTKKTIANNKMGVTTLPHKIVACTTFVPIPGSDIWYHPDKYNIEILSRDMKDYNFYFFGSDGVNELKPVIKLKDRPLDEFMEETREFRDWLMEREDVNHG